MIFNALRGKFYPKYSHWHRPLFQNEAADTSHRKATWLELFFDISFVAAVTEISAMFAKNYTIMGVLEYSLLYAPIWWLWIGMTFYAGRFNADKSIDRLFTFVMMLPIAGMSVSIHNGIYSNITSFILFYIISRIILIFLWLRAGYYNPMARPMARVYIIGFIASIIVWLLTIYADGYWQFIFWVIALLIEFTTPLVALNDQAVHVPRVNSSHLNERFGLFTIIVLAEIFLGVLHGVSILEVITFRTAIVALFGFIICFSLWSLYFDDVISHAQFPRAPWSAVWVYAHLPLTLSITAVGAALIHIIAYQPMTTGVIESYLLSGTLSLTLLCIAFIELAHRRGVVHSTKNLTEKICIKLRLIGAGLCAAVGFVGMYVPTLTVVFFLCCIMLHQVWKGMKLRAKHAH